jgi:hypothetical protein
MRAIPLVLLVVGLSATAAAHEDTTYGAGVTLAAATPIADVIAAPARFAGQTVRVEGVVTAVCAHMGCWMTLAPATPEGVTPTTLRLKVDDGVIVFPVSAKGRAAAAQGVIERVGADDHEAAARPAGAEPAAETYQLKVTGAIVH